jgi:calcineurin-like phosphoesterase family protein
MSSNQQTAITYDVIGDVHGHHDKLIALLKKLGYNKVDGIWCQPGHKAVFVGDLIDKGPKPAKVLATVQKMVDAGSAMMVIGNHELNWIQDAADHTEDLMAFLDKTENHPCRHKLVSAYKYEPDRLIELFQWLREQPIYIDHPDIRVVHACWDEAAITTLKDAGIERLCDKALASYRDTYSDVYLAMDRVIAGCAHQFPSHLANRPKFRSIRLRVQWWPEDKVTINPIEGDVARINLPAPDATKPPVFFGHYALTGTPDTLGANVASVDYSAAYGGPLAAYQHHAGQPLEPEHFVT